MSDGPLSLPAYEMKFLLDDAAASAVEAWAARHLPPDPHVEPALGNAYRTVSLYLDTAGLDVFHSGGRKFRVRRYGASPLIFLERKARNGDRVRKRRSTIEPGELPRLRLPGPSGEWAGGWFHARVLARGLRPACLVAYRRVAHLHADAGDWPLRLTIDRDLRGVPAQGWEVGEFRGGLPLLPGKNVLELKFRGAMPALFKQLVEDMGLAPAPVSKYRLCVRGWGLDRSPVEVKRA